jgi:Lrp/AsnC family leucine-responsive transcriptional regulator
MHSTHLDETDRALILCLQRNARIPSRILASKVGISGAECLRRVRRLEANGVIRQYVTLIDPSAVGLRLSALVRVRLERQTPDRLRAFEAAVLARPEVHQCWQLSDSWDFELLVLTSDVVALERFQRECFQCLGVLAVNVSIVVRQPKQRTDLHVEASHREAPAPAIPASAGFNAHVVWDDRSRVAMRRV